MEQQQADVFRWYERYPNLKRIITMCETWPEATQAEIGEKLNTVILPYLSFVHEAECTAYSDNTEDIFKHLQKSFEKNRWYDQAVPLRDALNTLLFLPESALFAIDTQCSLLYNTLTTYMATRAQDEFPQQ